MTDHPFKDGDRVRRVKLAQSFCPIGFVTTVKRAFRRYEKADGPPVISYDDINGEDTAESSAENWELATPDRFTVASRKEGGSAVRHHVLDHVMQIEVFHWYSDTGPEKCAAVASALNALGHEKD